MAAVNRLAWTVSLVSIGADTVSAVESLATPPSSPVYFVGGALPEPCDALLQ